jgi:hypothetical protein
VVGAVPEWAAVLALTALPLRLVGAHLANRLLQLGAGAPHHFNHLLSISWLVTFALLPALWGRALFVRACALALESRTRVPAHLVWRLPVAGFIGYAYAAVVWAVLFQLCGWLIVPLPLLALGTGLAAASAPLTGGAVARPGPLASLALALRAAPSLWSGLKLSVTFAVALVVAAANLFVLFRLGLALAGGIPGLDLAPWTVALGPGNRHFLLLLLACAVTLVEPFWLASLVAVVRAARARQSGEDLAERFAELRTREAA